jgi:hypothetical protein
MVDWLLGRSVLRAMRLLGRGVRLVSVVVLPRSIEFADN